MNIETTQLSIALHIMTAFLGVSVSYLFYSLCVLSSLSETGLYGFLSIT
jgi:hypothetical protein